MNPAILYTFPDQQTWESEAEAAALLDENSAPLNGVDVVGRIVDQLPTYDAEGNETEPATWHPGWHVNIHPAVITPPQEWDQYLTAAFSPRRIWFGLDGPAPGITTEGTPYDRLSPETMNALELSQAQSALRFAEAKLAKIEGRPDGSPVPRWQEFAAALAADPGVNALLSGLQSSAPVLAGMLTVGLGQAAQGDLQTFRTAWTGAFAAGAVSAELIASVEALAAANDLPQEFIEALTPAQ